MGSQTPMQEMSKNPSLLLLLLFLAAFSFLRTATASSPGFMRFTKDATLFPAGSECDYIIVGGGAAGCPLAATLSGGGPCVLLLERRGAPVEYPSLARSSGCLAKLATTNQDSPAQPFASEEGVANTRARVLGGGSSINVGFYSRAHPEFYTVTASSRGYMQFTKDATLFPVRSEYDYIIVGGGAAGCPLAATLLGGGPCVLLLERRGAPVEYPSLARSSGCLAKLATTNQDSPAQPFASEEGVANTRARVLGGGSSINAGFYSRAHPQCYTEVPLNWDMHSVNTSYDWIEWALVHRSEVRSWQVAPRDGLMGASVGPFFNECTVEQKMGMKVGGVIFDVAGRRHLLSNAKPDRIRVATRATVDRNFLNQAQPDDFVIPGVNQYRRMLRDKSSRIDSAAAPASPVARKSTWAQYRWISHIGFILGCSYNLLSWYLIVRYPTREVQQAWWNLGALLAGASATLLITREHAMWTGGWDATKEVLNAATTLLGLYGEAAVYRNHQHDNGVFAFLIIEIVSFARCMSLGKGDLEKAVFVIRIIQLAGGLISSVMQFAGFVAKPDWEFITYEAYAAILGCFYSLCDISETDGQLVQIVLLLLTVVFRFIYALGIMWRSHRQGIATWGIRECYGELVNFRTRYVRSFEDCLADMRELKATWVKHLRKICKCGMDVC